MSSRRRLPNLVTAVTATLSLALVAGACGSDSPATTASDAGSDAATTGSPTSTQPSGPATTQGATPDATPDAGGTATTMVDGGSDEIAAAPEALRFQAHLLGGGTFDGATYGERPVVFWFWAPT